MLFFGIGLLIVLVVVLINIVFSMGYKYGHNMGIKDGMDQILNENLIRLKNNHNRLNCMYKEVLMDLIQKENNERIIKNGLLTNEEKTI